MTPPSGGGWDARAGDTPRLRNYWARFLGRERIKNLFDHWEKMKADSTWDFFSWRIMHCNWCDWEGTRFLLIQHWLEAHDGRTNFEVR